MAGKTTQGAGSSSRNAFSEGKTDADGGFTQSMSYFMTASLGAIEPEHTVSANFVMDGGFVGTLGATSSSPWLTSAFPALM